MAVTLEDPAAVPNKMIRLRNRYATVLEITGHIEGQAAHTDYLTPGSVATLQSDGISWYYVGLFYRPILLTKSLAVTTAIGVTETDLQTDIQIPADGVWLLTGGYKMAHYNVGNNQPVSGEMVFRNATQANAEVDRIFWGVGRTSTDADFFVTLAAQFDVAPTGGAVNVNDIIKVYAVNTGSGDLDCEVPSGLEYSGPS